MLDAVDSDVDEMLICAEGAVGPKDGGSKGVKLVGVVSRSASGQADDDPR
jgi:hypothetical protein